MSKIPQIWVMTYPVADLSMPQMSLITQFYVQYILLVDVPRNGLQS